MKNVLVNTGIVVDDVHSPCRLVNDGRAGDTYKVRDGLVADPENRVLPGAQCYRWAQANLEHKSRIRIRIGVVGIESIDDVCGSGDKDQVLAGVLCDRDLAHVKWLRQDLALDLSLEEFAKRPIVDIGRLQPCFVQIGTGAGIIV